MDSYPSQRELQSVSAEGKMRKRKIIDKEANVSFVFFFDRPMDQ
jgi:hypothetical protein